ncbi:hypothetical protein CVT26_015591 [Gymnopilus dilepis]|uniref:DUF6533 domain-containing protein n=1 Tax=Gymnopilus dilepis TaxID=231916 RepID=A0A409XYU7_9AGAR|nr:hypothetical protein CVT26_015591 [Gymnopilus dilepis]
MGNAFDQANHNSNFALVQAVNLLSLAAVVAQAWDTLVSFSNEVEYLWRGRFRFIKALYFGSRYGMLAVQVMNQYLNFRLRVDPSICRGALVFKPIVAQFGLMLVEIILLIRVYALYNQSFKAKYLLLAIFIISTAMETIGNAMVVHDLAKARGCETPGVDNKALALSGVGAGLCQSVIFIATLLNLCLGRRRRTPLTSLMLREGVVSFILLLVLLAVLMAFEVVRELYVKDGDAKGIGEVVFSWYLALISIAGSRLILNMRQVAAQHLSLLRQEPERDPTSNEESIYLTSLFD